MRFGTGCSSPRRSDDETRDGENAGKRRGEDADVRVRGRGLCGVSESAGSVEA